MESSHIVQFYDNDNFLATTVANFLSEGLAAGEPALIIATATHRRAFLARLTALGFDANEAIRTGQLAAVDASETLATFMVNGLPHPHRFRATAELLLERKDRDHKTTTIHVYGEMVDVLWKEGNVRAAIQLDELWNQCASEHSFSLFCAYAMSNFHHLEHAKPFRQICGLHDRVLPAERSAEPGDETRSLEICMLQQRVQALEAELQRHTPQQH